MWNEKHIYLPAEQAAGRVPEQDKGSCILVGDQAAAVLCDGVGASPVSALGAAAVSRAVAELLFAQMQRYFSETPGTVRREVNLAIRDTLRKLEERHHLPARSFASTLLAIATDGNHCIGLHLGDGVILHQRDGDAPVVISYPSHGFLQHATFVTGTKETFSNLRFFCTQCGPNDTFLLATDGVENGEPLDAAALTRLAQCRTPNDLRSWLGQKPTDDASMIALTKSDEVF